MINISLKPVKEKTRNKDEDEKTKLILSYFNEKEVIFENYFFYKKSKTMTTTSCIKRQFILITRFIFFVLNVI